MFIPAVQATVYWHNFLKKKKISTRSLHDFFEKKNCVFEKKLYYDLVLICDSFLFYAHVHTFSPRYTDEE